MWRIARIRPNILIAEILVAVVLAAGVLIIAIKEYVPAPPAKPAKLPVIGSFAKLEKLMRNATEDEPGWAYGDRRIWGLEVQADASNGKPRPVDAADTVRTDGTYIYRIARRKEVVIAKVRPATDMKLVARISEPNFRPEHLHVRGRRLVVVGVAGRDERDGPSNTVRTIIYDTAVMSRPRKSRQVDLEGQYDRSIIVGSTLYVMTKKPVDQYRIIGSKAEYRGLRPRYRDSAVSENFRTIGYEGIHYLPGSGSLDYLIVAAADLEKQRRPAKIKTIFGGGRHAYVSSATLYVGATRSKAGTRSNSDEGHEGIEYPSDTSLYKFILAEGAVTYAASAELPGRLLVDSMDEYRGYLRVATANVLGIKAKATTDVHVLDSDLRVSGLLQNVNPGQFTDSVRFVGNRAYILGFGETDKFPIVSLDDPGSPSPMGILKLPGYAHYMAVLDDEHVIGFGNGIPPRPVGPSWGGSNGEDKLKLVLFDVSDVRHPRKTANVTIGTVITESALFSDRKSLLVDTGRGLMAFPATAVQRQSNPEGPNGGRFRVQGLYVFSTGNGAGLKLRGRISHDENEAAYRGANNIVRAFVIGNTLYTVSNQTIQAHDLKTLKQLGSLSTDIF